MPARLINQEPPASFKIDRTGLVVPHRAVEDSLAYPSRRAFVNSTFAKRQRPVPLAFARPDVIRIIRRLVVITLPDSRLTGTIQCKRQAGVRRVLLRDRRFGRDLFPILPEKQPWPILRGEDSGSQDCDSQPMVNQFRPPRSYVPITVPATPCQEQSLASLS